MARLAACLLTKLRMLLFTAVALFLSWHNQASSSIDCCPLNPCLVRTAKAAATHMEVVPHACCSVDSVVFKCK